MFPVDPVCSTRKELLEIILRGEVYFTPIRERANELTVKIWVRPRSVGIRETGIQVGMVKGRIFGESRYFPSKVTSCDERSLPVKIEDVVAHVRKCFFERNDFSLFSK